MKLRLAGIGHAFLGRQVIDGVDLTLDEGEVVALVGPSGGGKTTVLQIAAGLVDPLRGTVRRHYRRHAVVFQEPRLIPWISARDNIAYGLRAGGMGRAQARDIAGRRARDVGLDPADLDKYPVEMSGGMRQRAAVARALAVDPDIVFFDEPFSALDVGLRRSLQILVIEASRRDRFAALFVTHDLAEALRVAHRLVLLSGRTRGLVADRALAGSPGSRSDREIYETIEGWAGDPVFADLFDAEREGAA